MKNYNIVIFPTVQQDLEKITDHIAFTLCAPAAALNLINKIQAEINGLKNFPLSGKELQTDIPLKFSYRWKRVDNYLIFYTTDEASQTVTVMRIIYASSDYLSILQ